MCADVGGADERLRGRVLLVSGGASHIGRAIVERAVAAGAKVALVDRDKPQALATADRLAPGTVHPVIVDLTGPSAGAAAVEQTVERFGRLDVLVNNAGSNRIEPFLPSQPHGWATMVELNMMASFALTQAALPQIVKHRGSLIAISSDAALGEAGQAVYGATKAAMVAFMRALAREHGRNGVRCNVVAPGVVVPDDREAVGAGSVWSEGALFDPAVVDQLTRRTALGRLPTAHDVAEAVLFLADDAASGAITGQVLSVNGGFSMRG